MANLMEQAERVRASLAQPHPEGTTFVTDFLPFASFLIARGHEASLQQLANGTILFRFEPALPSFGLDISDFNESTALVEPVAYDTARIALRKRMDALKTGSEAR